MFTFYAFGMILHFTEISRDKTDINKCCASNITLITNVDFHQVLRRTCTIVSILHMPSCLWLYNIYELHYIARFKISSVFPLWYSPCFYAFRNRTASVSQSVSPIVSVNITCTRKFWFHYFLGDFWPFWNRILATYWIHERNTS